MTAVLLLIDIQNDYFPGGAHTLPGARDAVVRARELLDRFRAEGRPVVHVQHVWDEPDAPFMRPGTAGVEIHQDVAPRDGEPLVVKAFPNAFRDTGLADLLTGLGADRIVVAGMMSNLCVDATARAGADLGYALTVAADACAAADLSFEGVEVPAASVHAAFMAGLGSYGEVRTAARALAD